MWEGGSYIRTFTFKGIDKIDGTQVVKYVVKPIGVEAIVELNYIVNKDGSLTVDATYKGFGQDLPELPRFGFNFELQNRLHNFAWYGRGPYESYVDRKYDTFIGVWKGDVNLFF